MHHRTGRSLLPVFTLGLLSACGDVTTVPPVDVAPAAAGIHASDPAAALAALQATPPGHIRIGVVPSATMIEFGSGSVLVARDKESGAVLNAAAGEPLVADLETEGVVDVRRWLQTACTSNTSLRDGLLAEAAALGYETYTEFNDAAGCWRVLLGTRDQSFGARIAFRTQAITDGVAGEDSWWPEITIVTEEPRVALRQGTWSHVASGPVVMSSDDGLVTIGGRTYRGSAEVWINSGGSLAGINELPLEEYLYGVVPRELPPDPYGLPEAQKAQAVTARTYALANMGKRGGDGYDLLATTTDQVYGGYQDEHPVSTAAVDATAGTVAVHGGALITTLYHSTSGGWTANSEDVFSAPLPYLRGVPDAERGEALERVPSVQVFMRHANPINLRAHAAGDFENDWSRYHRWIVTWTPEEMASILASTLGASITEVRAVRVVDRGKHGRVRRIEFDTDLGIFVARKDAIRRTLQYLDADGVQLSLRSTLFFIEPRQDPRTRRITGWTAYGGGWGHGVGMSQTGAVGMAERGRSYAEILRHYYQGIELEQRD